MCYVVGESMLGRKGKKVNKGMPNDVHPNKVKCIKDMKIMVHQGKMHRGKNYLGIDE